MEMQMSKIHQTTYNALFVHPIAHNLQWHDVRSLLNALTDETQEHNGNLIFSHSAMSTTGYSASLIGAKKILIFGSSTGSSSAMDYLLADLKEHHPDIAGRVVGTVVVNEQHMTEDQLLAQARSFYAALK